MNIRLDKEVTLLYKMVVIDDEYIVVEGIKTLIRREGLDYDVVGFAYDGITALKVIKETRPDVVITDIRIPGLDGLSLIEEAKEFLSDTAFIVISGYNEFEYAKRALSLGVKGYIDKPITIDKIEKVLSRIENELLDHEIIKEEQKKQNNKQIINGYIDKIIQDIIREETDKIALDTAAVLKTMDGQDYSLGEYLNECYKFLCIILGAFMEQKKQYERDTYLSYCEFEKLPSKEAVKNYTLDIMNKIIEKIESGKSGSNHRIVIKLLEVIKEQYSQNIGLNELADMVNMNPAYLSILFKEEVGMTYIKYLTQVRLNHAKELLQQGYKVTEVSEMVGYNDYHYFSNTFKKNIGMKPNEYKGCVRKK